MVLDLIYYALRTVKVLAKTHPIGLAGKNIVANPGGLTSLAVAGTGNRQATWVLSSDQYTQTAIAGVEWSVF
jgi:hypothetical protein